MLQGVLAVAFCIFGQNKISKYSLYPCTYYGIMATIGTGLAYFDPPENHYFHHYSAIFGPNLDIQFLFFNT